MPHKVIEEIVASNEWRQGDFAKLKMNASGVEELLWCRLCIPLIYAHWEGYVVSSLKILLDHLNELSLSPEDIPTKLVVVGLGESYKSLSGKQSFSQRIVFTEKFRKLLRESIKFQKKIDTKSNLKTENFKELCEMYGFDYVKFSDVGADIDRLVNIRNAIAHGENGFNPDMKNVEKYIGAVTTATDLLREEIENFLKNEEYLIKKIPQ
ncbi:MAE_28990/MAE_18760 family HEPN-like nuclease [Xanthomonas sp. SHU 166]|uniref:MAE_28990/MAE_18760 family HEPN-like nuclease n=1 Tax=Xanthomonas sp. SHU 166 TaxID=1591170 RepID=UPI0012FEC393|nr:MAE_28990/MAE_18760 family HEPN-like nuclease [Xanthomonas sp. SHU 166]